MAGQTNPGRRGALDEHLRREGKAVALRAAGYTYAEVGHALGMDRSNVAKIVKRALQREHSDAVEHLRREEGARLDRLQRSVWTAATAGDVPAVMAVLRIMERRARLFGLDAPQRLTVTSELDEEIDGLLQQLRDLPPVPDDSSVVDGEVVPQATEEQEDTP